MKFYDKTKPLYLETDLSGVILRAGLLHTRSGTNCPWDKVLDPITFARKSLSCTEKRIQQHGKRETRYTIQTQKVSSLLLCKRGEYNHRLHTTSIATLLQKLQWPLLRIHQYRVKIIYKPGPDCYSKQTGCPDKITRKTQMQKYLAFN